MIRPTARQAAFHLLKAMKVHFHTAPSKAAGPHDIQVLVLKYQVSPAYANTAHHCGFLSLQDPQPINAIGPWDGKSSGCLKARSH